MTKKIFKNPITIYLRWVFSKIITEYMYKHKSLKIGYLSRILNCGFGIYNTIEENVYLSEVILGDFTYIASNTFIQKAKVGKFCSVGNNVNCGLSKHPSSRFVSSHPIFYSTLKQAQISFANKDCFAEIEETELGNDVWVGSNCIILGGIKIGDGAIIAAGAIVTKDVPPYAVVGGVPAKVIKFRFSDPEIEFLLRIKWWDWDLNELRKNYMLFHDINKFMSFYNKDLGLNRE